ncbi:hypothetical protein HK097_009029, partial [Rhizophlyctis rosea]
TGNGNGMEVDEEEWSDDEGKEVGVVDPILSKFKTAFRSCPPTPSTIPLINLYSDYIIEAHGLSQIRSLSDKFSSILITAHSSVRTALYQKCIEVETSQSGWEANKESVRRVRELWERLVGVEGGSGDAWLSYIQFELQGTQDFAKATHLYWRAVKCVEDKDGFVRRYEELKGADV